MAKSVDSRALALQALSRAIADPSPRPLFGPAKNPGIFIGTPKTAGLKAAADLCISSGWIEVAGEEGSGKKRVSVYRITPDGVREAIDNNEATVLLRDMLETLKKQRESFELARRQIDDVASAIEQQEVVLQELLTKQKSAPPVSAATTTASGAVDPRSVQDILTYLRDFRAQNPLVDCPLPELFHRVAEPKKLTIGQFHDSLRTLVARQAIRLFPYGGPDYALEEGEYAMIWEKEVKYYAAANQD